MKKTVKTAAILAALALMLTTVLSACGATSPATPANTSSAEDTITVSASASVRLVPDKASVSFGVTTQESTADQAQTKNGEAVKKVIDVLTERGVDEKSIRTTDYSLYPQYNYDSGAPRITGYVVRTSMTIQDQDIENVGKLLTDCVAAGINSVDYVSFLCSGYDEAYHQALAEAMATSRAKAEALAAAAGKTLGDAVTVTEGWQDTSARYGRSANISFDTAEAAAETPFSAAKLLPGESEIGANVTVTYRMK